MYFVVLRVYLSIYFMFIYLFISDILSYVWQHAQLILPISENSELYSASSYCRVKYCVGVNPFLGHLLRSINMPRECKNYPDMFCYVCGNFTTKLLTKQKLTN